jgi:hypothetical protein
MLPSFIWLDRGSIPQSTSLDQIMLTIWPLMWLNSFDKKDDIKQLRQIETATSICEI